jgi:hypothetical protein
MAALRGLSSREHGEVPVGSSFVEAEDVNGTVAAFDFAITVIRTVPLVEDLDHLDPIPVQTKRPGYLNPMAGLDHDTHVPASAAARALSKRSIPSVHALHAEETAGKASPIFQPFRRQHPADIRAAAFDHLIGHGISTGQCCDHFTAEVRRVTLHPENTWCFSRGHCRLFPNKSGR